MEWLTANRNCILLSMISESGNDGRLSRQCTMIAIRDVDITSIRFFQTDLVASFHHCLRVVKPAADDAGVLTNVMESGHRRFFEIRHGTGPSKLRDQRRYFLEDFDIQRQCLCHVFHSRVFSAPAITTKPLRKGYRLQFTFIVVVAAKITNLQRFSM